MERSCHRTVDLTRNTVKHYSFAPYDFKSFVMMLCVLWPAYTKSLNKTVLLIQCQCSVSCGQGIKKRNVTCGVADPTEKCDSRAVPISWAYCNEGICPVITLPPTTMVSRFNIIKKPFWRTIFSWVSTVFWIPSVLPHLAPWLAEKTFSILSTNQMQKENQLRLDYPRFPAPHAVLFLYFELSQAWQNISLRSSLLKLFGFSFTTLRRKALCRN